MKKTFAVAVAMIILACSTITTNASEFKGLELLPILKFKETLSGKRTSLVLIVNNFRNEKQNSSSYFAKAGVSHDFSKAVNAGSMIGITSQFFESEALVLNTSLDLTLPYDITTYSYAEWYNTLAGQSAIFSGYGVDYNTYFLDHEVTFGLGVEVLMNFGHAMEHENTLAWFGPHYSCKFGSWDVELSAWRFTKPLFDGEPGYTVRAMVKKTFVL